MIDDFIRETAPYRHAETAAYYQRLRVKWAVKEARLMETAMSEQRETAKSSTKVDARKNRKRRRADDDEEGENNKPPEPWPKRTKYGGGAKQVAVSDSTPGNIRRSKRLAKDKTEA